MSAARSLLVGALAAGLSYLLVVGYAQAQHVEDQIKPAQYADQDTGQPLSADQQQMADQQQPNWQGQERTTNFRGPDASGRTAGASQGVDHYLANCLLIKNQAEIKANEFAQNRTDDEQVKKFTRKMIEDHRKLQSQLQQIAGTQSGQNRGMQSGQNRMSSGGNDAALNRLLEIDRQITDRCAELTRQELESKSGKEFDWCFIGSQVGAHMQMLAALDVISQEADGQLQQIAQDAKSTVKDHLEEAKELAKELQPSGDNRQARRD